MSKTSPQFRRGRRNAQASAADDPLLAAWEVTLRERRQNPAILDPRGKVVRNFAAIETRARIYARKLSDISPGTIIAIQIGNHPDWPSVLLACLRQKLVAVPLEASLSEGERDRALCFLKARALLTALSGASVVIGALPPTEPIPWGRTQPCLLKLTSGTTAEARAVRFRSHQLLADCHNICETMGINSADLNYGVIPVSHSFGFSNLITPLMARGVALVLSSDRFPRAVLQGLATTRATVFPATPVFYQSFFGIADPPDMPSLRLCISAGAPLGNDVGQTFEMQFGLKIHPFYGASECGGICYAPEPEQTAGFVGPSMRGVSIEAIDRGSPTSPIRVRSDAVGDGYYPRRNRTLRRGVFIPDDLLEKTPTGYRIVGRMSDLINIAGKKVNPAEIEAEILRFPGIRAVVVFGREIQRKNQEIAACAVAGEGVREPEVLARCRARLSSWQTPRRIYFVDAIPVNERGKTSRRELARRYPAGT